jgi:hypothetical protein
MLLVVGLWHGFQITYSSDLKIVLGVLTLAIAVISYSLYIRDILRGTTKPHAISWVIWSVLSTMVFVSQVHAGAGAGAWVTAFTAGVTFVIFLLSLTKGHERISAVDWVCLIAAAITLLIWTRGAGELVAVVLACLIFILGLIPTLRKSWSAPFEETAITFFLNGCKFCIAIFALEKLMLISVIYPLTLTFANWFLVLILIWRRRDPVLKTRRKHEKAIGAI